MDDVGNFGLKSLISAAQYQIVRVFRENDLSGRISGGYQAAQVLVWNVQLDSLTRSDVEKALNLRHSLELALGVDNVRLGKGGGFLTIEIPSPRRYIEAARTLPGGEKLRVPIGYNITGEAFFLDFLEYPHVLILGATRAGGKSETLRTIAYSLARNNTPERVAFVFIDLKGGKTFQRFAKLIHSPFDVARTPQDAEAVLRWLVDLMRRRYKTRETGGAHIFLFIDDMYLLTTSGIGNVEAMLGELTSTARAADIHLVIASQEASQQSLGNTQVSRNIVTRISGKVDTPSSSFWALGVRNAGAEHLLGNGDVLVVMGGDVYRVQVGKVFLEDLAELPACSKKRDFPTFKPKRAEPANKIEIQPEWVAAYKDPKLGNGRVSWLMDKSNPDSPGLSSSVAYRVKKRAENGHESI